LILGKGPVNSRLGMMPGYPGEPLHQAGAEGENGFDVQFDAAAFIKKDGEF